MTFIEENRNKIKAGLKTYFDEMVKNIYAYEIPFIEYKGYVTHLENALKNDLIGNHMYYVVVLYNAQVLVSDDRLAEYTKLQNYLEELIYANTKKSVCNSNISLGESFKELIQYLDNYRISLDNYSNCCEVFKTCLIVDDDSVDYDAVAKALINAKVELEDTYQDNAKYYEYQMMLRSYLASIKQEKQL